MWEQSLSGFPKAGFFHSSAWCRTLVEAYGYRPFYLAGYYSGRIVALVPLIEVKSWLTGRRGVNLPFTDNCPPLLESPEDWPEIWEKLLKLGSERRWKYLELRGDNTDLFPEAQRMVHIDHVVDLDCGPENLLAGLRGSTRRNIRKAMKKDVIVRRANSFKAIREYFRLHVLTRKRHGLPPQPLRFFKVLYHNAIEKGYGHLFLAYRPWENDHPGKSIAGALFLTFGDKAVFKFGASELDVDRFRPNNMIMWTAIQILRSEGYKSLHLGRTDLENLGLLRFKDGWDSRRENSFYWNFDLEKMTFREPRWKIEGVHNQLFSRLPSGALKVIGSGIYRHIG